VASPANLVTDRSEDPQHDADKQEHHSYRPKEWDAQQESNEKKHYAESNHDASVVSFACHRESHGTMLQCYECPRGFSLQTSVNEVHDGM
jgi:hypothetical protein